MGLLSHVFHHQEAKSLSRRLADILNQHAWRICTGESVTAGRIATIICMTDGASRYFEGGDIAYNINRKTQKLGVDQTHARLCDCVSQEVAEQMARGARLINGFADIGIGITGYAGPYPEQGVFEPYAWVSVGAHKNIWSTKLWGKNGMSRTEVQDFYAREAVRYTINILAVHKDNS
jgi:nicotinamide-nucleotide amidase